MTCVKVDMDHYEKILYGEPELKDQESGLDSELEDEVLEHLNYKDMGKKRKLETVRYWDGNLSEVPCVKCLKIHPLRGKCLGKLCSICSQKTHTTSKCEYFQSPRCKLCLLRSHNVNNECNLKKKKLCLNCQGPQHVPEFCPKIWRVYVQNPKKTTNSLLRRECSCCGEKHLFDSCKKLGRRMQTVWNNLPILNRQATILQQNVEKY